jgi:hypothetical protein
MSGKSLNASPSSVHHTLDSHSIISGFEPFRGPESFVNHTNPAQDPESEATVQHETITSPQISGNELGIYEAPEYIGGCLSPLEPLNETVEPLATHVPEQSSYDESLGHIRSPILSK